MLIYLPELLAALQAYVDANADDAREPVSYFGKHEGKGEAFLIGVFGVIAEELLVRFPPKR